MTYALAAAQLVALSVTHSERLAEEAQLFGAIASSPGPGARLVVDAHDTRAEDEWLQRLIDDEEPLFSSDRDCREPHDTEPCPAPDDDDVPDDCTEEP